MQASRNASSPKDFVSQSVHVDAIRRLEVTSRRDLIGHPAAASFRYENSVEVASEHRRESARFRRKAAKITAISAGNVVPLDPPWPPAFAGGSVCG
jgi:hypothetical protein